MRLGALFSSGKDSTLALYEAMRRRGYEIKCLITVESENPYSFMFHTPNVHLTRLQAEAMRLPLVVRATVGREEEELEDLRDAVRAAVENFGIEGVVAGAVLSSYQRKRIEEICEELSLEAVLPLWGRDQKELLATLLDEGFEVIFTAVAAYGFDKSWLGARLDEERVRRLLALNAKYGVSIVGEGGEFETLVLDAPPFEKRLKILEFEILEEGAHAARLVVKKATLVESRS
ncbi:diphthine--ammonia ligase [Candidatus Alkanophaga liquidiphilum]